MIYKQWDGFFSNIFLVQPSAVFLIYQLINPIQYEHFYAHFEKCPMSRILNAHELNI